MTAIAIKLGKVVLYNEKLLSIKPKTLWSCGLARSSDKLITFHLYYYKTSSHCGKVVSYYQELPPTEIIQPFKHVVYWDHLTNQKRFVPTITMSEATKLTSVVTYDEGLPITKSDDDLDKWLCEVMWQIKDIKSDLSQYLLPPNLLYWWLTATSRGGSRTAVTS